MREYRVIGGSQRRIDVADKVTGRARYVDDLALPRMLHCRMLRSRVPHAELVRVDVSAALEVWRKCAFWAPGPCVRRAVRPRRWPPLLS